MKDYSHNSPPVGTTRKNITHHEQAIQNRLQKFFETVKARSRVLVLAHNNPDPDAIASAWGVSKLIRSQPDVEVTIGYAGLLGRSENRALIKALGEPLIKVDEIEPGHFDGLVVVDSQPGGGNVTLPQGLTPTAVFDHHPRVRSLRGIPFIDIRTSFGSCAALIYEYLQARGLELDGVTATCFYYAIRSETQELGREASSHDRQLFRKLTHTVDWELLHRIAHAPVPRGYFSTFKVGLERAKLYDDAIFADVGELSIPDAAAEIADWLLRLDEVKWALACGTYRGRLHFSLRTLVLGSHCGSLSQKIIEGWGAAGGHGLMAGGQVFLSNRSYDREQAIAELENRFLKVMGYTDVPPIQDPFAVIPGGLSRARAVTT